MKLILNIYIHSLVMCVNFHEEITSCRRVIALWLPYIIISMIFFFYIQSRNFTSNQSMEFHLANNNIYLSMGMVMHIKVFQNDCPLIA